MTSSFNWLSYLDVADHLVAQQGEGFYRSAVSRSYYAIFGQIRHALEGRGITFQRGRNDHRELINALRNDPRPDASEMGNALDRLRRERNYADYETTAGFDVSWARETISEARSIQNRFTALFP